MSTPPFPITETTPNILPQENQPLPQQPVLQSIWISSKTHVRRAASTLNQLLTEIREITIGNAGFAVKLATGPVQDSCYIGYDPRKQLWFTSVCPTGIPLRLVRYTELAPGCRELITTARCIFMTAASTANQHSKPIEIPARALRNVMQSLGFCFVSSGGMYGVFVSRIGRAVYFVVSIVPQVDSDGENLQGYCQGNVLLTRVQVWENTNVPAVEHVLRARDRSFGISIDGRGKVNRKSRGKNLIVLGISPSADVV